MGIVAELYRIPEDELDSLDRNIYGMSRAPDDGDLAYWIEYYEKLVKFVSESAAAGQGILIRYT